MEDGIENPEVETSYRILDLDELAQTLANIDNERLNIRGHMRGQIRFLREVDNFLDRLSQWDMFNGPNRVGDADFWMGEIEKMRFKIAHAIDGIV